MSKISDVSAASGVPLLNVKALPPSREVSSQRTGTFSNEADTKLALSALSRQLAAAAERAAVRDSQLSRQELATLSARIQMDLGGVGYRLTKPFHDAFVPDTDDQERLARAEQATAFVNGRGDNPFKALTLEQLSLIGYDEGGDFTYNERLAASRELGHRYSLWSSAIVEKARAEYESTGYQDETIREVIAYYKALPPIMEAGFGNYEIDLTLLIGKTDQRQGSEDDPLIEMILKTVRKLEDEAEKAHPPIDPSIKPGGPA